MELKTVLDEPLRSSGPVEVLQKSLDKGRLAHALLLHGDHFPSLEQVALALAAQLLEVPVETGEGADKFAKVERHPDFFTLRPSKKARAIRAEDTRSLIRNIQQSPNQGDRKVAVVYEADRLSGSSQSSAANIFLKTLEEPPLNTTILLLTTRPYLLLDTIRSRCFNFRLPAPTEPTQHASWKTWLSDYERFLDDVQNVGADRSRIAKAFMLAYGLTARFTGILAELVSESWEVERQKLPEDMSDEERDATREGSAKGIRNRLFKEIEEHTNRFLLPKLDEAEESGSISIKIADTVQQLEDVVRLFNVNLKEEAALEDFFLSTLRIWSR